MDLQKFYRQLVTDLLVKHGLYGELLDGSHNVPLGAYHFGVELTPVRKLYFLFVHDYLSVYESVEIDVSPDDDVDAYELENFNAQLADPNSLKRLDEFIVKVLADD